MHKMDGDKITYLIITTTKEEYERYEQIYQVGPALEQLQGRLPGGTSAIGNKLCLCFEAGNNKAH